MRANEFAELLSKFSPKSSAIYNSAKNRCSIKRAEGNATSVDSSTINFPLKFQFETESKRCTVKIRKPIDHFLSNWLNSLSGKSKQ